MVNYISESLTLKIQYIWKFLSQMFGSKYISRVPSEVSVHVASIQKTHLLQILIRARVCVKRNHRETVCVRVHECEWVNERDRERLCQARVC